MGLRLRGEGVGDNRGMGSEYHCPLVADAIADVEGDRRVSGTGRRFVVEIFQTNGVAMADEPCQRVAGRRKVGRAEEYSTSVRSTITNIITWAMKECDCRRHWRRTDPRDGHSAVRRDGDVENWAQRKSPLCVEGSLTLLRQPRSGRDHDLWRLTLCEATLSRWDRQTTETIVVGFPSSEKRSNLLLRRPDRCQLVLVHCYLIAFESVSLIFVLMHSCHSRKESMHQHGLIQKNSIQITK